MVQIQSANVGWMIESCNTLGDRTGQLVIRSIQHELLFRGSANELYKVKPELLACTVISWSYYADTISMKVV